MKINYEKMLTEYMWANGSLTSVARGKRFLDWLLLKLYNRTETELDNDDIEDGVLYCDGANDYGIDCAFVDGDVLYLIQGKYRNTHSYANVYHFLTQIEDFLKLENGRSLRNKLVDVYDKMHSDDINEIKIHYLTDNYIDDEAQKRDYDTKAEELSDKYSAATGKNLTLQIIGYENFRNVHTGILFELSSEAKLAKHPLVLERYFQNRDNTTIVAEVALKNLARMVGEHKDYIFSSNIRNYKGLNKINKGIKESYEMNPKDFWYYNNGITIVCNDYELTDNISNISKVTITAPQIVNGCQTATTIYKAWKASSEEERKHNDGTILVKIIRDKQKNKRNNITKYTNSQTAVSGKDFFALDEFHKELKEKFEEFGYFYETQTNSAKVKTKKYNGHSQYNHLFDSKFLKYNVMSAKEVTQIYISAMLEIPAKAKNIGQFMPGGARYEQVYNEHTPYDPRYFILPYGTWYYLKNIFDLPENKALDKDKWNASLLLSTYTAFRIISKQYFDHNVHYLTEPFIQKCEEIITNESKFKNLVQTTYNVISDFYKDTSIKDIIADNLPKFLKNTIESNHKVKDILDSKIEDNINI